MSAAAALGYCACIPKYSIGAPPREPVAVRPGTLGSAKSGDLGHPTAALLPGMSGVACRCTCRTADTTHAITAGAEAQGSLSPRLDAGDLKCMVSAGPLLVTESGGICLTSARPHPTAIPLTDHIVHPQDHADHLCREEELLSFRNERVKDVLCSHILTDQLDARHLGGQITILASTQAVDTESWVALCHLPRLHVGQCIYWGETGVLGKSERDGVKRSSKSAHGVLLDCRVLPSLASPSDHGPTRSRTSSAFFATAMEAQISAAPPP